MKLNQRELTQEFNTPSHSKKRITARKDSEFRRELPNKHAKRKNFSRETVRRAEF